MYKLDFVTTLAELLLLSGWLRMHQNRLYHAPPHPLFDWEGDTTSPFSPLNAFSISHFAGGPLDQWPTKPSALNPPLNLTRQE